jgi:hypothetical protein
VDLLGRPAADVRARVHEDLQQPDDAGLMDLDAWKGSYRIEGAAFIYADRKRGGMRAILGYPTQKLEAAARSS